MFDLIEIENSRFILKRLTNDFNKSIYRPVLYSLHNDKVNLRFKVIKLALAVKIIPNETQFIYIW